MPRKAKRPTRDPLLLEIAAAIGAGRTTIGPIHDDGEFVEGFIEGKGQIRINPSISVCDTAIHEITHRLRPKWSERAVRSKTTRLMRQMSWREIDKLYELILARSRSTKRPLQLEE